MPRVRERREQLQTAFSQHHLAQLVGISQTRISLIERGLVEANRDERIKIARALRTSEADLWPDREELAAR